VGCLVTEQQWLIDNILRAIQRTNSDVKRFM